MAEYPKRLYLDGLAVTVANAEEEERWLHPPLPPDPPVPVPDPEPDPYPEPDLDVSGIRGFVKKPTTTRRSH